MFTAQPDNKAKHAVKQNSAIAIIKAKAEY